MRTPEEDDARLRAKLECKDCGYIHGGYMLRAEVWARIVQNDWLIALCIWCAEARLGRRFTLEDFSEAAINEPIRYVFGQPRPASGRRRWQPRAQRVISQRRATVPTSGS